MAKKYPTFREGEFRIMTAFDNYNHVYGKNFIILEEGGEGKEKPTKAWIKVQRCFIDTFVRDGTLPYWTYKRFFGEAGKVEFDLDHKEDDAPDLL